MARYKVIKPRDHKYELLKKRMRIRKTADIIYIVLMLIGILICGINQFNNSIVGWGMIAMGTISVPIAIFHIYMDKKRWGILFWYDTPDFSSYYVSKEEREKNIAEAKFLRTFETVTLIIFSVGLPIFGVLKLLQII